MPGTLFSSPVRSRLVVLAAMLAALVCPAAAGAHIRSGAVAVDYRVTVSRVPSGVSARVYPGDRAVRLTAAAGHTVVVLGYLGEPFLRVDSHGVTLIRSSPTAASTRSQLRSSGRSVVWHDARLGGLPAGTRMGGWAIPLVVDGRRTALAGELERVQVPSPWPWLALGVPFVAAAALVLWRRRPKSLELAAIVLGALIGASIGATAGGFALDANASEGRWVEAGNEVVFAAVGLAVLARGRWQTKALAAGALGLLGLAVGVSKIPVFTHGVVLSVLPAEAARMTVAVMLWASAAAAAVGAAVFNEVLD